MLTANPLPVVHVCNNVPDAVHEIPALLRGEPIHPASGLGSNTTLNSDSKPRVPRAVICGKGFSDDEVATLWRCVGGDALPWLLPDDAQMTWTRMAKTAATAGTALPGIIAERVDRCMKAHGLVPGKEGDVGGGVWGF